MAQLYGLSKKYIAKLEIYNTDHAINDLNCNYNTNM